MQIINSKTTTQESTPPLITDVRTGLITSKYDDDLQTN